MLDLENSFMALENLPLATYLVLPINADMNKFENKIKKIGFPCWIKLSSSLHKTKIQAVKKCFSIEDLKKTHEEMKKRFRGGKFLIQENVEGVEIIAGLKHDKTFGKILLIGSGGSFAEIMKDIEFRVLPANKYEIIEALQQLKIFRILKEKNCNIKKLVKLIKKFSDLDIKEADLNPIIVNKKRAVVVDARVSI